MKIVEAQVALFNAVPKQLPWERISLALKERDETAFNVAQVTQLPVPVDAPPEIPRLMMDGGEYKANFSFARIDFLWGGKVEFAREASFLHQYSEKVAGFLDALSAYVGPFSRLGCSCKLVERSSEPAAFLVEKMAKLGRGQVKEFNLTVNYRREISETQWNDVTSYAAPLAKDSGLEGFLILRDVSTLIEEELRLSARDIPKLMRTAFERIVSSDPWRPDEN